MQSATDYLFCTVDFRLFKLFKDGHETTHPKIVLFFVPHSLASIPNPTQQQKNIYFFP
jgi:hypothetical protein